MDLEAYEQYRLGKALIARWGNLQEAHLMLEGSKLGTPFYGELLADVIDKLQAYERVLQQLDKRAEKGNGK